LFPSEEQQRVFEADPARFVPAAGGNCIVCIVEKGVRHEGSVEHRVIHEGRLYVFPSDRLKKMFERNSDRYADADVAVDGHCTVCMVEMSRVTKGKPEHASVYDGQRYHFVGPEQKAAFEKNPAAYAPAMGGHCTVCKVEKSRDVPGSATHFVVHNDRLYLFPSAKELGMFMADTNKYADADLALDGNCAVCMIKSGKVVRGRPAYALDHHGLRHLFPGRDQMAEFRSNPGLYVKASGDARLGK